MEIEPTYDPCPSALPITYEDKVGGALLSIPIGGILELAKFVKTENRPQFIAAVKNYIDIDLGRSEGWYIQFSNDYARIKKIEYEPKQNTSIWQTKPTTST